VDAGQDSQDGSVNMNAPIPVGGVSCPAPGANGCPDLDGNGVGDCTETLVMNPGFDTNTASWAAEPGVVISWDGAGDLAQKSGSGALAVLSKTVSQTAPGWFMAGAVQCMPVDPTQTYDFAAELSVGANNGGGSGLLGMFFYTSSDCSGSVMGTFMSSQVTATGMCESLTILSHTPPAGSASVALRLVSIKPFSEPPLTVEFDNVLFKKH
jgi:hypothetical protein